MRDRNHYETLGVGPDASQRDVRRAFLALAAGYKRAMISDPSFLGPYEEVESAYQALSDYEKRRRYNAEHSLAAPPSPPEHAASAQSDHIWEHAYMVMMLAFIGAGILIAITILLTGERPDLVTK